MNLFSKRETLLLATPNIQTCSKDSPPVARERKKKTLKLWDYAILREEIIGSIRPANNSSEMIEVSDALGRVCFQNVKSGRDVPENNVAMMDGYALSSSATTAASFDEPLVFYSESVSEKNVHNGFPTRYVSTGEVLPDCYDCIARLEEARVLDDRRILVSKQISKWKDVLKKAEDVKRGELLFERGRIFSSADLLLLIESGIRNVKVHRIPKVGIISVRDDPLRQNGSYSRLISSCLIQFGISAEDLGVRSANDLEGIGNALSQSAKRLDCIFTIGGSSIGRKDSTADAITLVPGSRLIFHGLKVLPIRPTGLALLEQQDKKFIPVCILPAHAVSVALAFHLVALPVVNLLSGLNFDSRRIVLRATTEDDDMINNKKLESLHLVKLHESEDHRYFASPLPWGSNSVKSLSRADGFVRLEPASRIEKGEDVVVQLITKLENM
jgi:molybdopterin molybdotransferase